MNKKELIEHSQESLKRFNRRMDVMFIESILPKHYSVTSIEDGFRCTSDEGIESDTLWDFILKQIMGSLSDRFLEVYHQVNHFHKDFNIYIKQQ